MGKARNCQLGENSKTQFFAAYKKCTLNIKVEKIDHPNTNQIKVGIAKLISGKVVFISDKVDFRAKKMFFLLQDKRRWLYNDKGLVNP